MRSDATGSSPYDSPMSWPNPRLVVVVLLVLVLVEVLLPCDRRGGILLVGADRSVAFECTPRQEAEDLQAIAEEEYRYHGAMVRLGVCALQRVSSVPFVSAANCASLSAGTCHDGSDLPR